MPDDSTPLDDLVANYFHAVEHGMLKVFAKMGISTLASYKGAQIFEALGLNVRGGREVLQGHGVARRGRGLRPAGGRRHGAARHGRPARADGGQEGRAESATLRNAGEYHWRGAKDGVPAERHLNDPVAIQHLQAARRTRPRSTASTRTSRTGSTRGATCAACLPSRPTANPSPSKTWSRNIVRRFCTGAMSYGSISMEAHATLARAMNRLGGKSNTGEGGENPRRLVPNEDGSNNAALRDQANRLRAVRRHRALPHELRRDPDQDGAGRQARRGRRAARYQGAGRHREDAHVHARRRAHLAPRPTTTSTPSRTSRSSSTTSSRPTPTRASPSKLVSEVGVGVVAAGVAKAKSDHIVISGTTAARARRRVDRASSTRGCRGSWDSAEAHQTLVLNKLRGRVVLQRTASSSRARRRRRRAARRRGVWLRDVAAHHARLHHDAQVPPQHVPRRHRHAGPRAAREVRGQARARRQLLLPAGGGDARATWRRWASPPMDEMVGRSDMLVSTRRTGSTRRLAGSRPRRILTPSAAPSRPGGAAGAQHDGPGPRQGGRDGGSCRTLATAQTCVHGGAGGTYSTTYSSSPTSTRTVGPCHRARDHQPQPLRRSDAANEVSKRHGSPRSATGTSSSRATPASRLASPSRRRHDGRRRDYVGKGLSGGEIVVRRPPPSDGAAGGGARHRATSRCTAPRGQGVFPRQGGRALLRAQLGRVAPSWRASATTDAST